MIDERKHDEVMGELYRLLAKAKRLKGRLLVKKEVPFSGKGPHCHSCGYTRPLVYHTRYNVEICTDCLSDVMRDNHDE